MKTTVGYRRSFFLLLKWSATFLANWTVRSWSIHSKAGSKLLINLLHLRGGNTLLGLASNTTLGGSTAIEKSISVLVKLQLGDNNIGGVDGDVHGLTVGLLLGDLVDGNSISSAVNLGNLSFATLVGTTNDKNLVILADRSRAGLCEEPRKIQSAPETSVTSLEVSFPKESAKVRLETLPRPVQAEQQVESGSWFSRYVRFLRRPIASIWAVFLMVVQWYYILPIPIILIASSLFGPADEAPSSPTRGNR